MPKSLLRISWIAIALVLVLWVPRAIAAAPPAIEPYLIVGKVAEGEAAMAAQLQKNPRDDQARFSLGVTQLMSGVEHLSQALYRYGLRQTSVTQFFPVRLPILENPQPETIRYGDTRQVLQTLLDDLAKVEATLAPIQDPTVKLPLHVGLIPLDVNANGKIEPDESFWRIFERLNRTGLTLSQAQAFEIAFDAGDAVWLRGYTHVLSAVVEFALAHDGQLFFNTLAHLMFEKPETPYPFLVTGRSPMPFSSAAADWTDLVAFVHLLNFPMQEPARMTRALQHLQQVTSLSRQSWKLIQAETDRDREWLPNPQQTAVFPNVRVTAAMIEGWMAFLDEADALLQGKTLLPFWRSTEVRGVNLNKVFTQPRATDVILWIQGTGAAPYLEFGKVTQPQFWQRLQETFGGQLFGFAAWFN